MNILEQAATTVEKTVSNFWKRISNLWNQDVAPELTIVEQEVLAILKPLFGQLEASALQAAISFIQGVIAASGATKGVDEWKVVIIQLAEVAGGTIWSTIKSLSSNALGALINLVLANLEQVAAEKAAAQAAQVAAAAAAQANQGQVQLEAA